MGPEYVFICVLFIHRSFRAVSLLDPLQCRAETQDMAFNGILPSPVVILTTFASHESGKLDR